MHHYLKKLVDERNSLTGLIQQLNDKAVTEDRQLSEAEAERQRGWQERCAELDPLISEQNDYLSNQRAWAKLQHDLSANDAEDPQPVRRPGTAVATRAPAGGLVRQSGWGEAFTSVLQTYDGHGTSGVAVVGSVLDERAPIDTSFIDTPPSIYAATPWKMTTPLLDAIGRESVASGNVEWVVWPGSYPLAAVVAEGALKPEATFAPTVKSGSLDTIAHDKGITRQALEDIPRIQQIVEGALRGGVLAKLEALAAEALTTDTDIATVTNDDLMAGIRVALGNVQAAGYASANAVLLNPADFAELDIAVMGATVAGPQLQQSFWGLQAIAAAAIPAGTAYVGDFKSGVTLFERGSTSLYVTDSHADYFLRNILVILAETRALAVVTEPQAIQKVTGVVGP
jgi:HK97 family phage major capsid protein